MSCTLDPPPPGPVRSVGGLLPLDGGHVAILAFEQVRSRLARAFGRRDPGRVDLNKVMPVTYAVFVALVGMSVILLYADIFRPINFNG